MVELVALRPLAMDRMYRPGEIFSIDDNTAKELEALGIVERAKKPEPPPTPSYEIVTQILRNKVMGPTEFKEEETPAEEVPKPARKSPVRRRGRPKKKK